MDWKQRFISETGIREQDKREKQSTGQLISTRVSFYGFSSPIVRAYEQQLQVETEW